MSDADAAGWLVLGIGTGFGLVVSLGLPIVLFFLAFSARE